MRFIVLAFLLFVSSNPAGAGEVQVYAAASLKTALDDVSALWLKDTGNKVTARIMPLRMNKAHVRKLSRNPSAALFMPRAVQPACLTPSTIDP